jgi:hypothetical protein
MAFRMNLDRVEYREPSTRAMRWLICPSIRKQMIRFWIIGLQFLPLIVERSPAAASSLFSNTDCFSLRNNRPAERCDQQPAASNQCRSTCAASRWLPRWSWLLGAILGEDSTEHLRWQPTLTTTL